MSVIGENLRTTRFMFPRFLIAARAMNAGVAILKPYLVEEGVEEKGTVVIGTVKGDLHDIGKNLVKMMMEGKGLKVIDLGVDVSAAQYLEAAKENNAHPIHCLLRFADHHHERNEERCYRRKRSRLARQD